MRARIVPAYVPVMTSSAHRELRARMLATFATGALPVRNAARRADPATFASLVTDGLATELVDELDITPAGLAELELAM
jgi:hypothetical protein